MKLPNFAVITSFVAALVAATQDPTCGCASIIVARASEEKPGTGMLGPLAAEIQHQIPDSNIVALNYPAELEPYIPSQTQGVAALTRLIHEHTIACPDTKLVLMGYSQVSGTSLTSLSPLVGTS